MKKQTWILLFLIGWAALAVAQVTTNVPPADNPVVESSDEAIRSFLTKYSVVKLFMIPIVMLAIQGFRKAVTFVPDQMWPYITPFIGVGLDYAAAKAGFWTNSAEAGAIVGGLATWFHQVYAQSKEAARHGLTYDGKTKEEIKVEKKDQTK